MPFDAGGNFTRVRNWQQDRDNGIRILADRHDAEDDNFAAGFNVAFLRTGVVPMTGSLNMGANTIKTIKQGGAASPSMTWELSPSTGLFQVNPNAIGVSSNGVKVAEFNGTGVAVTGTISASGGISGDLAVSGNGTVTGNLQVNGNFGAVGTVVFGNLVTISRGTGVSAEQVWGNPVNNWSIKAGTTTNIFSIYDNQFAGNPRLHFNSSGMGVATGNPQGPLHVAGNSIFGFQADPINYNIGFYGRSPAGGTVDWDIKTNDATNGARTSMTVTSLGNVGIGTISPPATSGRNVTIAGGEGQVRLIGSRTYSLIAGGNFQYALDCFSLYDNTAAAYRLVVNGAGKTGIGTAAPRGQLTSVESGTAPATAPAVRGLVLAEATDTTGFHLAAGLWYAGSWRGSIDSVASNVGTHLAINPSGGAVTIGEYLTPNAMLDVSRTSAGNPNFPGLRVSYNSTGAPVNLSGLSMYYNLSGGSSESTIVAGGSVNAYMALGIHNGTSYTEGLRVVGSGDVGIGATPDVFANYKGLTITGTTGGFLFAKSVTGTITGQVSADNALAGCKFGTRTNHPTIFTVADAERARIDTSGNFLVTVASGIGYGTGAGATVNQPTSRTSTVTINKPCGAIVLFNAASTSSWQSFTVLNSTVQATDTVHIAQKSGVCRHNMFVSQVAAGSFEISFAGVINSATESPVINFAVIKSVIA